MLKERRNKMASENYNKYVVRFGTVLLTVTSAGALYALVVSENLKIKQAREARINQTEEQAITEGKQYIMSQIKTLESKTINSAESNKYVNAINIYNHLLKEERDCFNKKYGSYLEAEEDSTNTLSQEHYNTTNQAKLKQINNTPMVLRSVN